MFRASFIAAVDHVQQEAPFLQFQGRMMILAKELRGRSCASQPANRRCFTVRVGEKLYARMPAHPLLTRFPFPVLFSFNNAGRTGEFFLTALTPIVGIPPKDDVQKLEAIPQSIDVTQFTYVLQAVSWRQTSSRMRNPIPRPDGPSTAPKRPASTFRLNVGPISSRLPIRKSPRPPARERRA